MSAFGGKADIG